MKNNVIRRIVVGIVAATMCLSLAACGNKDVKQEVAETTEQVAEVVEETAETAKAVAKLHSAGSTDISYGRVIDERLYAFGKRLDDDIMKQIGRR